MSGATSRNRCGMCTLDDPRLWYRRVLQRRRPPRAFLHGMRATCADNDWRPSTNCLQTGSDCIYPIPQQTLPSSEPGPSNRGDADADADANVNPGAQLTLAEPPLSPLINVLNDYVGGSFDALPERSKRLLRHCSFFGPLKPLITRTHGN